MPLKAIVDDIETVEEAFRGLYTQVEDEKHALHGRFVLTVEAVDGFSLEDTGALKAALSGERDQVSKLKDKLSKFDDLDPADVKSKLSKYEKLSKLDPEKEADRIAAEKIDAVREQAKKQITDAQEAGKSREDKLLGQIHKLTLVNEAKSALVKHEGNINLLLPHVERQARVREDDSGNFVVDILDGKGNPRLKDAFNPMTIEDLVLEMRGSDEFGVAFKNSGTTGGGSKTPSPSKANGAVNPWKPETLNLTEQAKITRENPDLAKRFKAEAGAA